MISNRFKSVDENEDLTFSNMTQQNRWEN